VRVVRSGHLGKEGLGGAGVEEGEMEKAMGKGEAKERGKVQEQARGI